jgi:hypothetical protein
MKLAHDPSKDYQKKVFMILFCFLFLSYRYHLLHLLLYSFTILLFVLSAIIPPTLLPLLHVQAVSFL